MTEKIWISKIAPAAVAAAKEFHYLASVMIAQTSLENGYGMDDSCKALTDVNNVLGMKKELLNDTWKSDYWTGEYIIKLTPEWDGEKVIYKNDMFRKYGSVESCLFDYCQFLRDAKLDNGKYKYRDVLGISDPEELITEVMTRGYCTDPSYAYKVMKIIEKHDLTQYDAKETEMNRNIIDITGENRIPAARSDNPIEWIVVHYLGVPNADNPYIYTSNGTYGYGGHYNVTRAGEIYKAIDPRKGVVWHCGGKIQGEGPGAHKYYGICDNWNSIGIECGAAADTTAKQLSGDSDLWYFTTETQESCAWLVAKLMREYSIDIDHVIRHYEVTGKTCPNPYVLNNRRNTSWTWDEFKARVAAYYNGTAGTAEEGNGNSYMVEFKQIHLGDNGEDVLTMQRLLYAQNINGMDGLPLKLDGDFGLNSEFALMEYQEAHGLEPDGWCGPLTWASLLGKAA